MKVDLIGEIELDLINVDLILEENKLDFEDLWLATKTTWEKMRDLSKKYERISREEWLPLY